MEQEPKVINYVAKPTPDDERKLRAVNDDLAYVARTIEALRSFGWEPGIIDLSPIQDVRQQLDQVRADIKALVPGSKGYGKQLEALVTKQSMLTEAVMLLHAQAMENARAEKVAFHAARDLTMGPIKAAEAEADAAMQKAVAELVQGIQARYAAWTKKWELVGVLEQIGDDHPNDVDARLFRGDPALPKPFGAVKGGTYYAFVQAILGRVATTVAGAGPEAEPEGVASWAFDKQR